MGKKKAIQKTTNKTEKSAEDEYDKEAQSVSDFNGRVPLMKIQEKVEEKPQIFSEKLKQKVKCMQKFYKAYFAERTKEDSESIETRLNQANEKMNQRLEKAFSIIMKEELKEVEDWIRLRQDEIQEEMRLLDCAIETITINLSSTKCFSEGEIEKNLVAIEEKKAIKKEMWEKYNLLIEDSQKIYEEQNIIEE